MKVRNRIRRLHSRRVDWDAMMKTGNRGAPKAALRKSTGGYKCPGSLSK